MLLLRNVFLYTVLQTFNPVTTNVTTPTSSNGRHAWTCFFIERGECWMKQERECSATSNACDRGNRFIYREGCDETLCPGHFDLWTRGVCRNYNGTCVDAPGCAPLYEYICDEDGQGGELCPELCECCDSHEATPPPGFNTSPPTTITTEPTTTTEPETTTTEPETTTTAITTTTEPPTTITIEPIVTTSTEITTSYHDVINSSITTPTTSQPLTSPTTVGSIFTPAATPSSVTSQKPGVELPAYCIDFDGICQDNSACSLPELVDYVCTHEEQAGRFCPKMCGCCDN